MIVDEIFELPEDLMVEVELEEIVYDLLHQQVLLKLKTINSVAFVSLRR